MVEERRQPKGIKKVIKHTLRERGKPSDGDFETKGAILLATAGSGHCTGRNSVPVQHFAGRWNPGAPSISI